jgi:carotenoid cleavage dioxygenase-like enzyme
MRASLEAVSRERPLTVVRCHSESVDVVAAECPLAWSSREIPGDLSGCLYRIGPNPQFAPRGVYNPLGGDGMIHAFNIRQGKVTYRHRRVRTQQWQRERVARRALFATSGNPREADPQVVGLQTDGAENTPYPALIRDFAVTRDVMRTRARPKSADAVSAANSSPSDSRRQRGVPGPHCR